VAQDLNELSKVLTEKFLMQLAIKINRKIKDETTITDLKKTVEIDKKAGTIQFDSKMHLHKILS